MLRLKLVKKMVAATMCIGLLAGNCFSVLAVEDNIRYFEGTGELTMEISGVTPPGSYDSYEVENVELEYGDRYTLFTFESEFGNHEMFLTLNDDFSCKVEYNGLDMGDYYDYYDVFRIGIDDPIKGIKIAFGDDNVGRYYFSGALSLVEVFKDDNNKSVDFTGTGYSVTGEYLIEITGSVTGEFSEGTTSLTGTEIREQNIIIRSYNLIQEEERTMDSSTINTLQVTVVNDEIVSIRINGRAMTANGNFDTYTIIIPIN